MDPPRPFLITSPAARFLSSSLPDSSPSPALPPARRKTFAAANAYRSSSKSLMLPPPVAGNAPGKTTPANPNSAGDDTLTQSTLYTPLSIVTLPLSISDSPRSDILSQRGQMSPPASIDSIADEESLQDAMELTPFQTSFGNDSFPLQHRALDLSGGRRVKRAKMNYDRTSDGYNSLPKQETASPVIRSISTPTESYNAAYLGPATNPARDNCSITQTNREDEPHDLIDGWTAAGPPQIRHQDEDRKRWADCSMEQWIQDGQELHNAFAHILERIQLGLVDDMTSIQSMQTLLDAHRQFLAQRDSVLVDVKKVILGGRGLWADDGAVL